MTRCPHGTGPASACSQCLGAAARQVTVTPEGEVAVDGAAERAIGETHRTDTFSRARNRGGRNWHSRGKRRVR